MSRLIHNLHKTRGLALRRVPLAIALAIRPVVAAMQPGGPAFAMAF